MPSGVNVADVFGHLRHHIKLERPQELGVMVRNMPLGRLEELHPRVAFESRPALTEGDLAVPRHNDLPQAMATGIHILRPAVGIGVCDPGIHVEQDPSAALAVRFRNVAS